MLDDDCYGRHAPGTGADRRLPRLRCRCRRFLLTFVRDPLRTLPQAVYEEPVVVHYNGHNVVAYVTDPPLIERVLLQDAASVSEVAAGESAFFTARSATDILTSEGAGWRCSGAPPRRHSS